MSYQVIRDEKGNISHINTDQTGKRLVDMPLLNKESAFSKEERRHFKLEGLLPIRIESLDEQVERAYAQLSEKKSPFEKYIYLNNLHERNETLFYQLAERHLQEMLPIIYTPTIGEAVEKFSHELRRTRGLFIAFPEKESIDAIFENLENKEIDLIVVTDSEGILGIGDQGVGGINICIGKLAVYTLCANIDPHRVLAIQLDVGTNNETLLNDPAYLGWRHPRIKGQEYDDFIDAFVKGVRKHLPNAFLHWEDFGRDTARRNLDRYREDICTFNDDMQGTGVITLASVLSALNVKEEKLSEQRIVFFGAGTSATGIADQMVDAMVREGLTRGEAVDRIYMAGRRGLLLDHFDTIQEFQRVYAKSSDSLRAWEISGEEKIELIDIVKNVKPTILIGCSTVAGAFDERVVRKMAEHTEYPIIFPLSNPTKKAEAHPKDLLAWTDGKALIATGSPFGTVSYKDQDYEIAQCNNAYAFPGIGLAILAVRPRLLTDTMLWAACEAIASLSPAKKNITQSLLPDLKDVKSISDQVAKAVIEQAVKEGLAKAPEGLEYALNHVKWIPKYYPIIKN